MFSFDKIISANDLQIDLEAILEMLEQKDELWVFDKNKPQFVITKPNNASLASINFAKTEEISCDASTFDVQMLRTKVSGKKIGRFVREAIRMLLSTNALPQNEIDRLTSLEYSKRIFKLNFPVLKEYNPSKSLDTQRRDHNNYGRYYNQLFYANNKQYLLSSQWVEYLHRSKFEQWFAQWERELKGDV